MNEKREFSPCGLVSATVLKNPRVVEVCAECDIADCFHIRARRAAAKAIESVEGLNPKDDLLWQAMEALGHTLRELNDLNRNEEVNRFVGNYGDAVVVHAKLEQHFGVAKKGKKARP